MVYCGNLEKANAGILILLVMALSSAAEDCVDPCNKLPYCLAGQTSASIESNCTKYFRCDHLGWLESELALGVYYEPDTCQQTVIPTCSTCPDTGDTEPGPCDSNIVTSCTPGKSYADKSDCTKYYSCTNGQLGDIQLCSFGKDECLTAGPCAFDISKEKCIIPDLDFNCTFRCPVLSITETPESETSIFENKNISEAQTLYATTYSYNTRSIAPDAVLIQNNISTVEANLMSSSTTTSTTSTTTTLSSAAEDCVDPCIKLPYCLAGQTSASIESNCTKYFICNHGSWLESDLGLGVYYKPDSCQQTVIPSCRTCPDTANTDTGPCDSNVVTSCTPGKSYADKSDCTKYYSCTNGQLGDIQLCSFGKDECLTAGPCAFDISKEKCIIPQYSFNCTYRCPAVMTTEQQILTTASINTTDHTSQDVTTNPDNIFSSKSSEIIDTTYSPDKSTSVTFDFFTSTSSPDKVSTNASPDILTIPPYTEIVTTPPLPDIDNTPLSTVTIPTAPSTDIITTPHAIDIVTTTRSLDVVTTPLSTDKKVSSTHPTDIVTTSIPPSPDIVNTQPPTEKLTTQHSIDIVTTMHSLDAVTTLFPSDIVSSTHPTDIFTTSIPPSPDIVNTQPATEKITTQHSIDIVTTMHSLDAVTTLFPSDIVSSTHPTDIVTTSIPPFPDIVNTQPPTEKLTIQHYISPDKVTTPPPDFVTSRPPTDIVTTPSSDLVNTQPAPDISTTQLYTDDVSTATLPHMHIVTTLIFSDVGTTPPDMTTTPTDRVTTPLSTDIVTTTYSHDISTTPLTTDIVTNLPSPDTVTTPPPTDIVTTSPSHDLVTTTPSPDIVTTPPHTTPPSIDIIITTVHTDLVTNPSSFDKGTSPPLTDLDTTPHPTDLVTITPTTTYPDTTLPPTKIFTTQPQPLTDIATTTYFADIVTTPPFPDIVSTQPSIDIVTTIPSPDIVTNTPSIDMVTAPPATDIFITTLPSDLVTNPPSFHLVTTPPQTDLLTTRPPTDLITTTPSTDIVTTTSFPGTVTTTLSPDIITTPSFTDIATTPFPTDIVTTPLLTDIVTNLPPADIVTTPPSTDLVTTTPPTDIVTTTPSADLVTTPPSTDLVTTTPSPDIVTTTPPTDIVTTTPSTDSVATTPPTDIVTTLPPDAIVTTAPPHDIVTTPPSPGSTVPNISVPPSMDTFSTTHSTEVTTSKPQVVTTASSTVSYSEWSPWSPWSECSISCGGGTRSRNRTCNSSEACIGENMDTGTCASLLCPYTPVELQYGYVITLAGITRSRANSLLSTLQFAMATITNSFCNADNNNVQMCCQTTTNFSPDQSNILQFVTSVDILIEIVTVDFNLVMFLIVVIIRPSNALCSSTTSSLNGRKKRALSIDADDLLLPQDVLETIIGDFLSVRILEDALEVKYQELFNETVNITLVNSTIPMQPTVYIDLETTTDLESLGTPGTAWIIMVSIVTGGIFILNISILLFCVLRRVCITPKKNYRSPYSEYKRHSFRYQRRSVYSYGYEESVISGFITPPSDPPPYRIWRSQ